MAEFPALPLFTDSLVADTDHLTDEEFGAYLRMLIVSWRSSGCDMPNDMAWIKRRFVGAREHPEVYEQLIDEFFTKRGSRLQQKRLMREREYVKNKSAKQSARAKSRWQKENDECRGNAAPHASGNAPTPTPTPTPESPSLEVSAGNQKPKRRKVIWPEGFCLTPKLRAYAERKAPGCDVDRMWEQFENHHRAKGSMFVDWERAWYTWCNSQYTKPMNGTGQFRPDKRKRPQLEDVLAAAERSHSNPNEWTN